MEHITISLDEYKELLKIKTKVEIVLELVDLGSYIDRNDIILMLKTKENSDA